MKRSLEKLQSERKKEMEEILEKSKYGEVFVRKEGSGYEGMGLKVETEIGTLYAYPNTDPEYPGICMMFKPKGVEYEIDITYAAISSGSNAIDLYSYEDPYTEDWTRKSKIYYEDIKDALNENG